MAQLGSKTRHLFTLPQELQDKIFDFAYADCQASGDIKPMHSWKLRLRFSAMRRGHTIPIRLRDLQEVTQFFISKKFFVAAAKAWVGSRVLEQYQLEEVLAKCPHPTPPLGVISAFATTLRIGYRRFSDINQMEILTPNITTLVLSLYPESVFFAIDKWPLNVELDDQDCHAFAPSPGFERFERLRHIRLIRTAKTHYTSEQMSTWRKNEDKLEAYLTQLISGRDENYSRTHSLDFQNLKDVPLYAGSKVKMYTNNFPATAITRKVKNVLREEIAPYTEPAVDSADRWRRWTAVRGVQHHG